MPSILAALPDDLKASLQKPFDPACADDTAQYAKLVPRFKLNPKYVVPPTAPESCARRERATGWQILGGPLADEPDQGIDDNLADFYPLSEIDPKNDRSYTGGNSKGPTKGIRHLYFAGLEWSHAIRSFQFPFRALGQNPERILLYAEEARSLLKDPNNPWGYRILLWAVHYLQDLNQPFHSTQVPSLSFVIWSNLFQWPASRAFHTFISEGGRTLYNYHTAYESFASAEVLAGHSGALSPCLENSQARSSFSKYSPEITPARLSAYKSPLFLGDLASVVLVSSRNLAPEVGRTVYDYFGPALKEKGVDLPHGKGTIDYQKWAAMPELENQRKNLEDVTCTAIANTVYSSKLLIEWALQP
jgi:hypothetical protein